MHFEHKSTCFLLLFAPCLDIRAAWLTAQVNQSRPFGLDHIVVKVLIDSDCQLLAICQRNHFQFFSRGGGATSGAPLVHQGSPRGPGRRVCEGPCTSRPLQTPLHHLQGNTIFQEKGKKKSSSFFFFFFLFLSFLRSSSLRVMPAARERTAPVPATAAEKERIASETNNTHPSDTPSSSSLSSSSPSSADALANIPGSAGFERARE